MARALWKGSIGFGLVEIPVTLRPALRNDDLSFTLLHRKDFAPVGYKRYDKKTGKEVPWDQVVRGYEYEPDEYVVLTDEELRRANVKATQTIEIVEFVAGAEIDPLFYDTPYYVEPQRKGSKAYALLRDALRKSGRVGIARVVLRTRQHVAALLVRGDALVLNLLRYAHEFRPVSDVEAPAKRGAGANPREVQMAERLIEGMTGRWKPDRFRDEYREDVMALVKKKVRSHQTHTILESEGGEESPAPRRAVVDLMPLLKQSLAERSTSRRAAKTRAGQTGPRASRSTGAGGTPRTESRHSARRSRSRRERRSA